MIHPANYRGGAYFLKRPKKRGAKKIKLDMRTPCGYIAPRHGMQWDNEEAVRGNYMEIEREHSNPTL